MKRDNLELDLPPAAPAQRALIAEFADWCDRHGFDRPAGDDPMLLNLLDRRQRVWLSNFIARWDWSTEEEARAPGTLRTPLELAGAIVTAIRENCSREEFADLLARRRGVLDFLDLDSVIALAFSRLHRVPVDGPRTLTQRVDEDALKTAAYLIVAQHLEVRRTS